MKRFLAIFALMCAASPLHALDRDGYSITPGGGCFYALRHRPVDRPAKVEVVGSEAAVERAKSQARKGGYPLDIGGPFGWHMEATEFIRAQWDPTFGRPPQRTAPAVTPPVLEKRLP